MFDLASANLTHVGRLYPDPKWAMKSHSHNMWEFIYFVRGTGLIDLPSTTIRAQQYHLVVYPPGLAHAEISDPTDPEETIFLMVDVNGKAPAGIHFRLPDMQGDIGWICNHIYADVQAHGITELAQVYTKAFLLLTQRVCELESQVHRDVEDAVIQYINTNYSSDISLENLSHVALASRTHISHLLKQKLGVSPMQYLQKVRLENAKRLISTSNMPVGEIASQVGFPDALYFSRVFKKATGFSPSEYRKHTTK